MKNWMGKLELELLHTPDTTLFKQIKNIIFAAAVYVAWAAIVIYFYKNYIPQLSYLNNATSEVHNYFFTFISMCIFAPLWEEILFRWVPLEISRLSGSFNIMFIAILASSVIFAILHPLGVWSIPIQGVGGLLFSYVYLKNGNSYPSAVAVHFLINFTYFITHVL